MENVKNHKKTLQELTFKDNFMFAAVMLNPDIAKGVLERILDQKIDHVEVSTEKSIVYNPEYKGIRLDVYLKDANLEESQKEFSDGFVSKLQQSVNQIKVDREMGRRFMLMEEIRRQEFQAGKLEGKIEGKIEMIQFFLSNISPVPEYLSKKIASIESSDILSELCVIASKASSLEEFEKQLDAMKI